MTVGMSEAQLLDLVINWVRNNRCSGDLRNGELSADTDLIASGLVDSFAFIDLIVFVESQSGCKIDLTDVDPKEFCVVKGLCKIILRSPQN